MDLVVAEHGIAVRLDPDTCHRVVKDLVVLNDPLAPVVHEDAPVLAPPDLVPFDQRIASRPETCRVVSVTNNIWQTK